MKTKTTKKEIMQNFSNVIFINYCRLQTLLSYNTPRYYTSGVNGWSSDIYEFGNTAIVTGYRPFGNMIPDASIINKYEQQARDISQKSLPEKELNDLIKKFIHEVVETVVA